MLRSFFSLNSPHKKRGGGRNCTNVSLRPKKKKEKKSVGGGEEEGSLIQDESKKEIKEAI